MVILFCPDSTLVKLQHVPSSHAFRNGPKEEGVKLRDTYIKVYHLFNWWVMLSTPVLLLLHPTIIYNFVNVPAPFLLVFKFMFKVFFICGSLSSLLSLFGVGFSTRGAASVVVKVLQVDDGWFVVGGTPGTRCCWVSDLIRMGNFNIWIKLICIKLMDQFIIKKI